MLDYAQSQFWFVQRFKQGCPKLMRGQERLLFQLVSADTHKDLPVTAYFMHSRANCLGYIRVDRIRLALCNGKTPGFAGQKTRYVKSSMSTVRKARLRHWAMVTHISFLWAVGEISEE